MLSLKEINGEFDPLTLSITETIKDDGWRDFSESFRNSKNIKDDPNNWRVLADITNKHEHDHFKRHVSSELGIFFTILLILRHQALLTFVGKSDEYLNQPQLRDQSESIPRFLSNAIYCLFGSATDITQSQAVSVLNQLFELYFGISDLFYARLPDAPACPSPVLGYANILEASAIASEYAIASTIGLSDEEIKKFLRAEHRDYDLYFRTFYSMKNTVKFTSACKLLCCYALDAQIPFFGTTAQNKISWEQIHPGWRLYNFTHYLKQDLEKDGLIDMNIGNFQYVANVQYDLFNRMERLSKIIFNENSFYERSRDNYKLTPIQFQGHLTPSFKAFFQNTIMPNFNGIIEHAYFSHNSLKEECSLFPLNFYLNTFAMYEGKMQVPDFPEIPKHIFNETYAFEHRESSASALYSIQLGKYRSIYWSKKPDAVLQGIQTKINHIILHGILNRISQEKTMNHVSQLGEWDDKQFQLLHDTYVKEQIDWLYSLYKY